MAQQYIPGLTPRPADFQGPNLVNQPKEVPPELIESFKNGTKQPVMALMEYSAMLRLNTVFKEVPIKEYSFTNKFANQCSINGKPYPQGVGKTKKEAKASAARIAMEIILGLAEDGDNTENTGNFHQTQTQFEYHQSGEYEPPPQKRDFSSVLKEYCRMKGVQHWVKVGDEPGPLGFEAQVIISGRVVGQKTGKTHKAARDAALADAVISCDMENQIFEMLNKEVLENEMSKMCYKKLDQLLSQCSSCPNLYTAKHSFAAFFIKRSGSCKVEIVQINS